MTFIDIDTVTRGRKLISYASCVFISSECIPEWEQRKSWLKHWSMRQELI